MTPILGLIPALQREVAAAPLPGIRPVGQADWITVDGCYTDQIKEKSRLIAHNCGSVLAVTSQAQSALDELLTEILTILNDRSDFDVTKTDVTCPDGRRVPVDDAPLMVISQLIQEDIVVHQPMGDVHGMTAALLCFPASWTLSEKIGKPLIGIHKPVPEYDAPLAKRVQRLFDGVQVGRPIWRANLLPYDDAVLFQPRPEHDPRPVGTPQSPYERSERQTLFRLPQTRAVIFAIHTTVGLA